ncbi:IS200/IS605 family transposase [Candidatus Micrarchaeota archaeon]|nr:IS200/IS605 family transposase [Candidatus Micrarchaeota archaeon]
MENKTSSVICNINYHIVFCPKYRKAVLKGDIKKFLETCFETIAETKGWKIHEFKVMPDHIHLFLSPHPYDSPTAIVKILKGVSALQLFKRFPELKQELWNGHIWSPSYYVGTAGKVSADTIERHIREQERNSSTV